MATLTSTKIKNTYDALLKATDNDAIGSSAKQITDGLGNGTPLYISTTQIGIGVTPEATYDLHVYSNAKVGGNLTVTGDLTVEGTTTTIDTQTLTVEDPLIEVASNNTSTDAVDIGWYGKYAPSGTILYAGLFRDTGDSKFKLFRNLQEQPTTTVNTSGTGYTRADLVIGDLDSLDIDAENITLPTTGTNTGTPSSVGVLYFGNTNNRIFNDLSGGTLRIQTNSNLDIKAENFVFSNTSGNLLSGGDSGVVLYYQNSQKLTTTTGGIEVTGQLSLSDGSIANPALNFTNDTDTGISYDASSGVRVSLGATERFRISNGFINLMPDGFTRFAVDSSSVTAYVDTEIQGELTVTGTGQSSFGGQVTIPATPVADTDAASKGYVDGLVEGQDTLAEILANGNTTGGTDIAISSGDSITFAGSGVTSTVIEHNTYDTRIINDSSLGAIILRSADTVMQNAAGTETIAHFYENGAVELYYDNSKKFETISTGVQVTGDVDVISSGSVNIGDSSEGTNARLSLGASNDFLLYHFTENYIQSTGADLNINAGTQNVEITAGGVGIGVSPSYKLDIAGTSPRIRVAETTSNTANTMVEVENSDGRGAMLGIGGSARTDILANRGYINAQSETDGLAIGTEGTDPILFYTQGVATSNERMRIDSSGNVGIGTTTPLANILNIHQSDTLSNSYIHITQQNGGSLATDGLSIGLESDGVSAVIRNRENGNLKMFTNNTERMRIDSSGNIGIGTTSPDYKLEVESTSDADLVSIKSTAIANNTQMRLGISGNDSVISGTGGSTGNLVFKTYGSERMRITSGGDIGIGISPQQRMHMHNSGTSYFHITNDTTGSTSGSGTDIGIFTGQSDLQINNREAASVIISTSDTPRMTIDSSGRVGIGTTSPITKLHVSNSGAEGIEFTPASGGNINTTQHYNRSTSNYVENRTIANNHTWFNGGTQVVTINSSGSVGIGTTSPARPLSVNSSQISARFTSSSADSQIEIADSSGTVVFGSSSGNAIVQAGAAERMRIDSSGNVGIGKTTSGLSSNGFFLLAGNNSYAEFVRTTTTDASANVYISRGNNGNVLLFYRNDVSSTVGSVSVTSTATSYNTSSDYRLKENVVEMTGALDRVSQLKPSRFNFIADADKTVDGFLAHEVSDIVPEAITGTKDEVDDEGNPVYQGIDQSKLVPLLVGAIKELKAEIETLKAQIN